jgi:hypothetical protein
LAGQRSLLAPRTTGTTFSGSTTNLSASGCPTNRRRTKQLIYVINPARSCLAWLVPPFSLCFLSDAPHDPISLLHLPSIYRPIYTHPSHLSRLVSLLSCCVSTYYLRQESLALLSPHLTLVATVYLYSVTLHVSIYTSPFVHGLQKQRRSRRVVLLAHNPIQNIFPLCGSLLCTLSCTDLSLATSL